MSPVTDNPVIVPHRELKEEKKPGEPEPPRIRCPLCGWSARKEDKWFCELPYYPVRPVHRHASHILARADILSTLRTI